MAETKTRHAAPDHCPKCGEWATHIGVQRPDFGGRHEMWCSNAHSWLATVTDAVPEPLIMTDPADGTEYLITPVEPTNG